MSNPWPQTVCFFDEVVLDAFKYGTTRRRMTGWTPNIQQLPKIRSKVVDPLEIVCSRCGAAVGAKCTDTNRRHTFERKPHRRRKDDAARAQEAANAMLTRR